MPPPLPSRPDDDPSTRSDLAAATVALGDLLLERTDLATFLDEAITLTTSVTGASSGGVTLRRDGRIATVAVSDDLAAHVDEIQYGRGQGPCLDALHAGVPIVVDDLVDDERWPSYGPHALDVGVRSSLSLPLEVDGLVRGALNLYSRVPGTFHGAARQRGDAFARQVGTALALLLRTAEQSAVQEQLREALETRAVVDQAMGILMAQHAIDARAAFDLLRRASQRQNRKLREVAAVLIETVTGHPPVPPRPFADPR